MAKEKKPISTFAEFEGIAHPHIADIKRVLREYAESGAHINGQLVLEIIGRLKVIHKGDAAHMAASAKIGMEAQDERGQAAEVREYEKLYDILHSD